MKNKTIHFIILLVLLALAACSPQPQTDVKPIQKNEQQPINSPTEKRELGRPAEFYAFSGNGDDNSTTIILGHYCWTENGKGCLVEPEDPRNLLSDTITGRVKPGDRILFSMGINPSWTWLSDNGLDTLQGTRVDITQIFKGVETRYKNVGNSLDVPEEPGRYFYLATVTWDLEVKGQANYAFAFSVSPDN